MNTTEPSLPAELADDQLVGRIRAGETSLFEIVMRRHNQRIYRTIRAILRNDSETEDVMQEAYVQAFAHLSQFEGRAKLSTWLTRIAVHEAYARLRRRQRFAPLEAGESQEMDAKSDQPNPEKSAGDRELGVVLEHALDGLPDAFRIVFVLREVEEMSVAETAQVLDIPEETVKTRLFRARRMLRESILDRTAATLPTLLEFHLSRCDRVVGGVLGRIRGAS